MPVTQKEILDALPRGFIVGWYNTAPVPAGWLLCDGRNNTPNLVGKFAMGAASHTELNQTGGAVSHSHAVNQLVNADGWNADDMNRGNAPQTTGFNHTHSTNAAEHLPPYQKIIFIMKG